jgi:hypothetical protein
MPSPTCALRLRIGLLIGLSTMSVAAAQPPPKPTIQDVEKALRKELAATEAKVKALDETVSALILQHYELDGRVSKYDFAMLDATKVVYQRVDSNTGSFLVAVDLAERYLNGYKLKVRIGNTTSVTYTGFTMAFKWGRAWDSKQQYGQQYGLWLKSLGEKSIDFVDNLPPGTWHTVDVVLVPAAENELAYLRASISTSALMLR